MLQFKKFITIAFVAVLGLQALYPALVATQSNVAFSQTEQGVAESEKVPVEVFVRPDCKHCHVEKEFFVELKLRRDDFTVRFHDISEDEHYQHWLALSELEKLPKVTPITLVGNKVIQGFDSAVTTGKRIEDLIDKSIGKDTMNFEEFIASGGSGEVEAVANGVCDEETGICTTEYEPILVTIPLIGTVIDVKQYSLPSLSVILGFIDGFNPCAMWVLVTFIIVLMEVGSRRKMWQIAGLFILAETIMYYLILNVWLYTWDFVGLDSIITPIVGLVSIGGGIFFLYEWRTSDGTCKVTNLKQRQTITQRIRDLINADLTLMTVVGILMLAFSVNIIEFACSIGIPQTFTKILDISALDMISRQFYMFLYILFYMVDDIIVFGIAIYSMEKIGLTTKYSKISNFVGGILMILLGSILLFRPDWLVF